MYYNRLSDYPTYAMRLPLFRLCPKMMTEKTSYKNLLRYEDIELDAIATSLEKGFSLTSNVHLSIYIRVCVISCYWMRLVMIIHHLLFYWPSLSLFMIDIQ